jgi:hypothetical protein
MRKTTWKSYTLGVAAVAFGLISAPASAVCDFLTGGGFIITTASGTHLPAKANFGVGGGCKQGSPTWGHLQYIDHGSGLNVHWLTITGYFNLEGGTSTDSRGRPIGTRFICGTARTNQFGEVDFLVRATDAGEPSDDDEFDLLLTQSGVPVYSTFGDGPHKLEGGNIQLHKPTTGDFGGSCAAGAQ